MCTRNKSADHSRQNLYKNVNQFSQLTSGIQCIVHCFADDLYKVIHPPTERTIFSLDVSLSKQRQVEPRLTLKGTRKIELISSVNRGCTKNQTSTETVVTIASTAVMLQNRAQHGIHRNFAKRVQQKRPKKSNVFGGQWNLRAVS